MSSRPLHAACSRQGSGAALLKQPGPGCFVLRHRWASSKSLCSSLCSIQSQSNSMSHNNACASAPGTAGAEGPSRRSVPVCLAPNSSTPINPAPPSPAHANRLGGAPRPTLLKPLRFSKDPMPEDEAVKAPVPGIPPLQKPAGWGPKPQKINSTPQVSHQAQQQCQGRAAKAATCRTWLSWHACGDPQQQQCSL